MKPFPRQGNGRDEWRGAGQSETRRAGAVRVGTGRRAGKTEKVKGKRAGETDIDKGCSERKRERC